ncbi:MAG: ATP-binding protein [Acidobacteria bacterium]|nr:ATP-binding protein [Acidobacteriota bacterium]
MAEPNRECDFNPENVHLQFEREIPSTLDAADRVIADAMALVQRTETGRQHQTDIELALREAVINAIVHGNQSDPAKRVHICCACDNHEHIFIIVQDEGIGFDPHHLPDPTHPENLLATHGRGIFLINQLMDRVKFDKGGREIRMVKTPRP